MANPQPSVQQPHVRQRVIQAPPSLLADFNRFVTNYPAVVFIASCVLVVNLIYVPSRFADYGQYLVLTDGLYYFNARSWLDFEVGSNLLFLNLRILSGNTIRAVNLAHYLLGIAYVWFLLRLARREEVTWRGVMVTFGLYGALLAFVTIRATPAYMLVSIAALDAARGRVRAVWLTLAATLFHVSAVLAVPPILFGLAQNRLTLLGWIERSTYAVAAVAGAFGLFFVVARSLFTDAIAGIISIVPFLNKYTVYTDSLDPLADAGGGGGGLSTAHLAYAVVMSAFAFAFVLMPDQRCRRLRGYVLSSYVLFLILEFAPVTAYRQSQFWLLPAMLVFPWDRFAPAGFRAVLFAGACVLLFRFTLGGVVG